jgi:hypothetical protein
LQLGQGGVRDYFLCIKEEKKESARIPGILKGAFAETKTTVKKERFYELSAGGKGQRAYTLMFFDWHPDLSLLYRFMRDKHRPAPVQSDADRAVSLNIQWSYALQKGEQQKLLKQMSILLKETDCPEAQGTIVGKLLEIIRWIPYWRKYAANILAKFSRKKNSLPAAVILWSSLKYDFANKQPLLRALLSLDNEETGDLFTASFCEANKDKYFRKYLIETLASYPAVVFLWSQEFSWKDVRSIFGDLKGSYEIKDGSISPQENPAASPLANPLHPRGATGVRSASPLAAQGFFKLNRLLKAAFYGKEDVKNAAKEKILFKLQGFIEGIVNEFIHKHPDLAQEKEHLVSVAMCGVEPGEGGLMGLISRIKPESKPGFIRLAYSVIYSTLEAEKQRHYEAVDNTEKERELYPYVFQAQSISMCR